MKAIVVQQPWASLIAHGLKRIVTTNCPLRYMGPLAIVSGSRPPSKAVMSDRVIRQAIAHLTELPLSQVVAICFLASTVSWEKLTKEQRDDYGVFNDADRKTHFAIMESATLVSNGPGIARLPGLFNVKPEDELLIRKAIQE